MSTAFEFANTLLKLLNNTPNVSLSLNKMTLTNNEYFSLAQKECNPNQPLPPVQEKISKECEQTLSSQGWRFVHEHSLRVLRFVRLLTKTEPVPHKDWLELAAILHDIGKPFTKECKDHARVGARISEELLNKHGFKETKIPEWVSEHSSVPTTHESMILYDADKLDKTGISGVCVLIAKAHLTNLSIKELTQKMLSYPDEKYLNKHLIGPDKFYTLTAKKLVPKRTELMNKFFSELKEYFNLS